MCPSTVGPFTNSPVTIGVLALQGGFSEHISHTQLSWKSLTRNDNGFPTGGDLKVREIRTVSELERLDGLIIPGGETTTISVFLEQNDRELLRALQAFGRDKPIFGTCAGMIMLADEVEGQMEHGQLFIGGIGIKVCRNYYGSQKLSFEAVLDLDDDELKVTQPSPMLFIRAPGIESIQSSEVKLLARFKGSPVAVRQNHLMAASFHPELTNDLTWHSYFIKMVMQYKGVC